MRIATLLIAGLAVSGLSLTPVSAQNQPAPDAQHQMDEHKDMHRDMHHSWHGHRHCAWKWRHHHRVRVCW